MKKQLLLLLTLLLCSKGFSQNGWCNYPFVKDHYPGSVIVDLAVNDSVPLTKYPFLVTTDFNYRTCNSLGKPDVSEETYFMEHIYITLMNVLDRFYSREVGIYTYLCKRKYYSYVSDTINLRDSINKNLRKNYPDYSYNIIIQLDKELTVYKKELYPDKYHYEIMLNWRKMLKLLKADVNSKLPIKYDFPIQFKSKKNLDDFLKIINEKHLKFESIRKAKSDLGKYLLTIYIEDKLRVDDLTDITLWLKEKAPLFKGNYKDWDSPGNTK